MKLNIVFFAKKIKWIFNIGLANRSLLRDITHLGMKLIFSRHLKRKIDTIFVIIGNQKCLKDIYICSYIIWQE